MRRCPRLGLPEGIDLSRAGIEAPARHPLALMKHLHRQSAVVPDWRFAHRQDDNSVNGLASPLVVRTPLIKQPMIAARRRRSGTLAGPTTPEAREGREQVPTMERPRAAAAPPPAHLSLACADGDHPACLGIMYAWPPPPPGPDAVYFVPCDCAVCHHHRPPTARRGE